MAASVINFSGSSISQGASGNLPGAVGSGAGAVTSLATTLGATSKAIPIAGAVIGAVTAIAGALLAAHQQRMQDAKTENARVAAAVPSFYQTVQQIVNAYNSSQMTAADTIAALSQLDAITYNSLRQFVGQPGTAWNSNQSGVCDKTCTVGCCIYNTWLHPDIFGAGSRRGVVQILEAGSSSPIWQGGVKNFAGIPTNKYAFPGFPSFTMTLRDPASDSVFGGGGGAGAVVGDLSSPITQLAVSAGLPATIGGFSIGTLGLLVIAAVVVKKLFS